MNSNKWVRTIKNRKGHKGLQQGLGVFAAVLTFHPGFVNWKREKSLASLPSFPISLFCHKVWIRFLFSCACGRTNYLRNIQLRLSVLLLQGVGDQDESQVLFPDCQPLALTCSQPSEWCREKPSRGALLSEEQGKLAGRSPPDRHVSQWARAGQRTSLWG